jgi:predicted nucleotidyltransferase
MEPNAIVEALREALAPLWQSGQHRLIVLFGSAAKGTTSSGSDLDLAFLPREGMDELAMTNEVIRLTHRNEVDVVDLSRADPLTRIQVARHGVVLFSEGDTTFPEFSSLAFRMYVDCEKLRRAQRRALDLFQNSDESR